tara:strand:- start:1253 stop:2467 length:1215 start_codon:yes stop_codon:yes gene_type:complete
MTDDTTDMKKDDGENDTDNSGSTQLTITVTDGQRKILKNLGLVNGDGKGDVSPEEIGGFYARQVKSMSQGKGLNFDAQRPKLIGYMLKTIYGEMNEESVKSLIKIVNSHPDLRTSSARIDNFLTAIETVAQDFLQAVASTGVKLFTSWIPGVSIIGALVTTGLNWAVWALKIRYRITELDDLNNALKGVLAQNKADTEKKEADAEKEKNNTSEWVMKHREKTGTSAIKDKTMRELQLRSGITDTQPARPEVLEAVARAEPDAAAEPAAAEPAAAEPAEKPPADPNVGGGNIRGGQRQKGLSNPIYALFIHALIRNIHILDKRHSYPLQQAGNMPINHTAYKRVRNINYITPLHKNKKVTIKQKKIKKKIKCVTSRIVKSLTFFNKSYKKKHRKSKRMFTKKKKG